VFRFNFSELYATQNNIKAFKHVVAWYIENLSGATANNYFQEFRRFLKGLAELGHGRPDQIGLSELLSYRSELNHPRMWRFGAVSRVIRKWYALGVPGVSKAAVSLLEELTIPGNEKGAAIRTMDPFTGPLIDIEYDSVVAGLRDRYACGALSTGDYVLALLVIALGPRPLQLAALKLRDFIVGKDSAGSDVYLLRVPRAKQPGNQMRSLFTERLLHSELGRLVESHVNSIRSQCEMLMSNSDEVPLFPARRFTSRPAGFEHHSSSNELSKRFTLIVEGLKLRSIRTGLLMRVTPYRFRRTVGTRAAAEGLGELVIASILDHSDTQNVGVYVENVPAFAERIDRAAAFHFAAVANAFMGEVVSRRDSISPSTSMEAIWSPQFSEPGKSAGGCVDKGPCAALAPIACYTCRRFRPFFDGPHDVVLEHLLQEREALRGKDERIAKVLDQTILAVAQVIQKCELHSKVK
jgi:integrase